MTTINISQLIVINDDVIAPESTDLSMAALFLTQNTIVPNNATQRVLKFDTLDLVAQFFGESSDEYTIATNYFNSFTNAQKSPDFILFGRYINAAISPYIRGGAVTSTLAQFKAITAGAITFNIDGAPVALTGVNLASATSLSQVAGIILTALKAASGPLVNATFTYDAVNNVFTFDTKVTGVAHTIAFCNTGTLAGMLKFQSADGGYLSQGADAATPAENMDALVAITRNWVGFTNVFDLSSETDYATYLGLAKWANDNGTNYTYVLWTKEANLEVMGNTANIATELRALDYANYIPVFGDITHAGFILGIGASIDYTRVKSVITWAFKSQNGLLPSVTTDAAALALIDKGFNFYGLYSSKETQYRFFQTGLIGGKYKFIDNFYNEVWLDDQTQNGLANLAQNSLKLSNDQAGYRILNSTLDDVMQSCINNGIAQIGNTFNATVKAELRQQAGLDITGFLTNKGYYIQIIPATEQQRVDRDPPTTTIWYTNGGAIHKFVVNVTAVF